MIIVLEWCDDLNLLAMVEADTKYYYSQISSKYIEKESISSYVKFATEELARETDRIRNLWDSNLFAIEIIIRACETELIENHQTKLEQEFSRMLKSERHSELNLLFKLLGKNEGASLALMQSLGQLILRDFDTLNDVHKQSCQEIIDQITQIYRRYCQFIDSAFQNDEKMRRTLLDSISQIINDRIKNSWPIFSSFIDENLKRDMRASVEFQEAVSLSYNLRMQ